MTELIALLDNQEVGRVQNQNGRLSFVYKETWRSLPAAYPLSLSMPLTSAEHGHAKVDAFLWGLLPDNSRILENWGSRFHVSPRNVFGLIAAVGEDCAGAVQWVRPERLETVLHKKSEKIDWLTETEIAARLRSLQSDPSAWRQIGDTGQFSLAGAQAKTALLLEKGRWGIPSGRIPTTHILKPSSVNFEGHVENEHFCLQLAQSLGLPVPRSHVLHFEDQVVISVERYDRRHVGRVLHRVHQEDICQALGLVPTKKYENEGGPGIRQIMDLLRTHSADRDQDFDTFLTAIALNWLIAGTDAHAKNYALLLGAEGAVRLAPLYDVASILPYPTMDVMSAKLAMKIGGEYRLRYIGARQWEKLATTCGLRPEETLTKIKNLTQSLPDHIMETQKQLASEGLRHPLLHRLSQTLITRAQHCKKLLGLQ
jgi:serine/threonine-protein kinase HipA